MATNNSHPAQIPPRLVGSLALLAGLVPLLWYPLDRPRIEANVPLPRSGPVIWVSIVAGALLVTWGWFAVRDRTYRPFTAPRALVPLGLGILCALGGLARFAVTWARATPIEVVEPGGPRTIDPALTEILLREFGDVHVVSLAAVSAVAVGTVTARRGPRAGLASLPFPAGILALAFVDPGQPLSVSGLLGAAGVLGSIAFAVGYYGARRHPGGGRRSLGRPGAATAGAG